MATHKFGKASRQCKICGTHERMIRSYGINICARCFREVAPQIGFKKYE